MRGLTMIVSTLKALAFALVAATIATPAHAIDERNDYPNILTVSPKGVNIQTGRFEYSATDISIGSLSFQRVWGVRPFCCVRSFNWSHNQGNGVYMTAPGGSVFFWVVVDGKKYQFVSTSGSPPLAAWNTDAQGTNLAIVSGTYVFTDRGGNVYYFFIHPGVTQPPSPPIPNPNQLLQRVDYADGHRIDYTYNSAGQTRTVISNRGYALVLDYGGNGKASKACGYNTTVTFVDANSTCTGAALQVSYGYSTLASGEIVLTSVTNLDGSVTSFSYSPNPLGGLLSCVTLPNSATCAIQNVYGPQPGEPTELTKADQVRIQTTATGETWLYEYEPDLNELPRQPGESRYTYATMTDPSGAQAFATYNVGVVESIWTPAGTVQYQFNGTVPLKETLVELNSVTYTRDTRQNLTQRTLTPKPGSPLAAVSASWSYPANNAAFPVSGCIAASAKLCDKPIYKIDERGYQTDYTYDSASGLILTETLPAVGGVRPQTRYTYAQRYAWVKNSGGTYVQAATPIWVLTQKSICKAGAASGAGCATGTDEVRTTYDYGPNSGPNNLLLRGTVDDATGAALRTCFSYDWQGNKISETKPRAGLTSCP